MCASKSQSSGSVPTRKARRFSWNFSRPSPSFDLDPTAFQESPIFMVPGLAAALAEAASTPQHAAAAQPERMRASSDAIPCSPQVQPPYNVADESPRRMALRRRATVAFGAVELQGRLNDMALEAAAAEEDAPQEKGEQDVPQDQRGSNSAVDAAKEAEDLDQFPTHAPPPNASSGAMTPQQKKRNRLSFPMVLRRQNTKS